MILPPPLPSQGDVIIGLESGADVGTDVDSGAVDSGSEVGISDSVVDVDPGTVVDAVSIVLDTGSGVDVCTS